MSLTHCCRVVYLLLDMVFLCRSVAEPQRDLGAQASPSRMRSPDPKVVVESLADNARTATPPRLRVRRGRLRRQRQTREWQVPRTLMTQERGGAVGDIGTPASPRIIDVDPINARPGGVDNNLVKEQAQIDQAPGGPGTFGARVPDSSPTSPRLPR
jgi:hypothetical protein